MPNLHGPGDFKLKLTELKDRNLQPAVSLFIFTYLEHTVMQRQISTTIESLGEPNRLPGFTST